MTNTLYNFLSDKYASGEASLDNCEAYLSVCDKLHYSNLEESNMSMFLSAIEIPAGAQIFCQQESFTKILFYAQFISGM
jgi:hypothetical protein